MTILQHKSLKLTIARESLGRMQQPVELFALTLALRLLGGEFFLIPHISDDSRATCTHSPVQLLTGNQLPKEQAPNRA